MVGVPERSAVFAIGRVDRVRGDESSAAVSTGEGGGAVGNDVDVDVFDTSIDLWYPPVGSGKAPSRRTGAAAALMRQGVLPGGSGSLQRTPEPMLIIFGGLANRGAHEVS